MVLNKPSICLICDKEAFKWIPVLLNEWKIKYLFYNDDDLKACFTDIFKLYDTQLNNTNDIFKSLDEINSNDVDLIFLALSTNIFHEQILQYIIEQKKFFYIFSSNLPTLNIQKLKKFRTLLNNFNSTQNIIYDVKEKFKNINKQYYWNIFNPLLNEQVFHSLKDALNELGHIYGVQIESTFIPFFVETEDSIENVLFYRAILITSLINFLFGQSKYILAKYHSIQNEGVSINGLSGNMHFDSMNCVFNISSNNPNKIFKLEIYGANGFIVVSYNKDYNSFQLQRFLNHYEYPNLYTTDSQQNALDELKYFIEEKFYTNKYINNYIDSIDTTICLWKSEGVSISLENKESDIVNENNNKKKIEIKEAYVAA